MSPLGAGLETGPLRLPAPRLLLLPLSQPCQGSETPHLGHMLSGATPHQPFTGKGQSRAGTWDAQEVLAGKGGALSSIQRGGGGSAC